MMFKKILQKIIEKNSGLNNKKNKETKAWRIIFHPQGNANRKIREITMWNYIQKL